jgi:AbrB family looped-hinge helix DNA binding protein
MEVVTISSKYQVVIPREVWKQFNLKPGQKIMFIPNYLTREKLPHRYPNKTITDEAYSFCFIMPLPE